MSQHHFLASTANVCDLNSVLLSQRGPSLPPSQFFEGSDIGRSFPSSLGFSLSNPSLQLGNSGRNVTNRSLASCSELSQGALLRSPSPGIAQVCLHRPRNFRRASPRPRGNWRW
mmetsp:Transcript_4605/g.12889  ORF Transcript_4605/g.12889 Transcript_4605/m.12889 type:complete len:114 (+) Transcript_4605:190-531(+)